MRNRIGRLAGWTILLATGGAGALRAEAPPPGTISVEARAGTPDLDAAMPAFVGAVDNALADKGFTVLEGAGHAGLVARVRLARVVVGGVNAKVKASKASAGPGGAQGVGASASVPFGTSKTTAVPLQQTRLDIVIGRRGDTGVLWQGSAVTVRPAGTRQGRDDVVAANLTEVLLRNYPAQSDETVSIP